MANPFEVRVPNVLEALMAGEQGFKQVRGAVKESQMSAVREQAAQEIMQGGNPQSALARLLSIGDDKGASTLASVIQNQNQAKYQQQQLGLQGKQIAQTGAYQQGQLGLQSAQLAETRRQHDLTAMQPFKLGTDAVGNEVYGVRDTKSPAGYRILNPAELPGATPSGGVGGAPAVPGGPQPAAPGAVTPAAIAPLPFKPTDSEKTDLSKASVSYRVLDKELESYGNLIKENGVSLIPGTAERARYDTARRNIQLQMKELYNLGVLNGPDLALMNQMLVDPTAGVRPDATVSQGLLDAASAPVRALYKTFTLQGQANANITDLRNSMKNLYEAKRDTVLRRSQAGGSVPPPAPPGAAPAPQSGVVDYRTYFGSK